MSETVLADLASLDRLSRRRRWNIDVRVYCASSTVDDTRVRVFNDWRDVLRQAHFQTSELLVYHFGIYNAMHESMHFARRDAIVVGYFHNVTPPQYCPAEAEDVLHRSFQQIETFRAADVHVCASHFSAKQLKGYDLGKPVEVVPLFGPNASIGRTLSHNQRRSKEPMKVLFCGRFAQSKGVATLIEALAQMKADAACPISATMTGISDFSDQGYVSTLRVMAQHLPKGVKVAIIPNMTSGELRDAYANADVFVLPSFHEGFGMPVVEAFSFGTPVICSDAGALPEIANGLALTFPAGDSRALAERLEKFRAAHCRESVLCNSGDFTRTIWRQKATAYSSGYSRDAYIDRMTPRFASWLDAAPHSSTSYRAKLESLGSELYGRSEGLADPADAAVVGGMRALEISDTLARDSDQALRGILKWPFPHEQSDQDIAYWRAELNRTGLYRLARRLADSPEVRLSPARLQVGASLQALLAGTIAGSQSANVSGSRDQTLDMTHPEVVLLLSSKMPASQFVREAYRLVFHRDSDPMGFGAHFSALNSGRTTRKTVLESLLASTERAALVAGKEHQTPATDDMVSGFDQELDAAHPSVVLLAAAEIAASDFVREAYRLILKREPDPQGFDAYLEALNSGNLTQKALLDDMLSSPERVKIPDKD